MRYHFKIHPENAGFWAECVELEGCVAQGDSIEELCDNMYEALNHYILEPLDSKFLAPLPDPSVKASKTVVEVGVDPQVAFGFLVRHNRIKNKMTQQEVAQLMGFDKIYSYQRLESRCNPSLATITKVKEVFPDFSLDFALSI